MVERLHVWPAVIYCEIDVFIPKSGAGDAITDKRPVSLAAEVYRLYGCQRYSHLEAWQKEVMPEGLLAKHRHKDYLNYLDLTETPLVTLPQLLGMC